MRRPGGGSGGPVPPACSRRRGGLCLHASRHAVDARSSCDVVCHPPACSRCRGRSACAGSASPRLLNASQFVRRHGYGLGLYSCQALQCHGRHAWHGIPWPPCMHAGPLRHSGLHGGCPPLMARSTPAAAARRVSTSGRLHLPTSPARHILTTGMQALLQLPSSCTSWRTSCDEGVSALTPGT